MPRFDAMCGPFNTPYSPNIQSEMTINWIPETNGVSVQNMGTDVSDKNVRCSLIRTPGLSVYVNLPLAPVRGVFPGEFRMFAVGGDHFYEVHGTTSFTLSDLELITDNLIQSASYSFSTADVGATLTILTSEAPWIAGTYTITAADPPAAFLSANAGVAGASQGVGTITTVNQIIDRSTPGFPGASNVGPAGGPIGSEPGVPVQFFSNGNQVVLISAGQAFCDNGNGPVACQFSDPLTDLVVDPGNPLLLTTATGNFFDATDIGRTVQITGGAGFFVGLIQIITAVTNNGEARGDQPWGIAGSALGTGLQWMGNYSFDDLALDPSNSQLISTPSHLFGPGDIGATIDISASGGTVDFTDLFLITDNQVESGSYIFTQGNVGDTLTITSTSPWTPGTYTITSINAGAAFLDADAGVAGADNGVGTLSSLGSWVPGAYKIIGLVYDSSGNPTGTAILNASPGAAGSTGGVGTVSSEYVTAFQGAFLDEYFFVCPYPLTKTVFFSGAPDGTPDGTMWDPTNFFVKNRYPDNVDALFADHEELYVAGDLESIEVYRDVGDATTPFVPDPGAIMHLGCQAPFSFTRLGNGVAWIAQDTRRGTRKAVQAVGYQPVVVSTPAVEAAWMQYSTVEDAVAFTFMYEGHELWVISFPTANATWFYDASTGWWGQWGWFNGTGWDRILTWVHCVVALDGKTDVHYGGDYSSGAIYIMSRQYNTDNNSPMQRRRRAPHMTNENMRRFYARFEIDCDVLGLQRIFWNRLGTGRDRIWQMDVAQLSETASSYLTLSFSDDRTQSWQYMYEQPIDPSVEVSLANAYLNWTDATWH